MSKRTPGVIGWGGRDWVISRRVFLQFAAGTVAGGAVASLSCAPNRPLFSRRRSVRFGIVTDCHYADADPAGSRFYRESLGKLSQCVARMNAERVDFLIELGDFKDQDAPPVESRTLTYLQRVEAAFQRFRGPTYHVLGNHDMDSLSKQQFLTHVKNTGIDPARSYYSFDVEGVHCIVLDANYQADGSHYDHGNFDWTDANVPASPGRSPATSGQGPAAPGRSPAHELDWLKEDLAAAQGPVIVFIHQLLDGTGSVYVKNAFEVRAVLEASGNVLAVFQGHHHEGGYSHIGGIHYYTLRAMVEGHGEDNNSYAIAEVRPNRDIVIAGFRKAESMRVPAACRGDDTRWRTPNRDGDTVPFSR